MRKNIIVFTGGGVAPALNATIYGVVIEARKLGYHVLGGLRGWHSLASPDGQVIDLSNRDISGLEMLGGTCLRTSRTNPFTIDGGRDSVCQRFKELDLVGIVASGGDNSIEAASKASEELGLPVVAAPKTIDNDLDGTHWTPGFPTAAQEAIRFVSSIKRNAYTNGKIYLVEMFGGEAGWLAAASYYGSADIVLPPEKEVSIKKLISLMQQRHGKNGLVVVVNHYTLFDQEVEPAYSGKMDSFGLKRPYLSVVGLRKILQPYFKQDIKVVAPTNFFSAVDPIAIDREFAIRLGQQAVQAIHGKNLGTMSRVKRVGQATFEVDSIPLPEAIGHYRSLGENLFDFETMVPTTKFAHYLGEFVNIDSGNSYFEFC